MGYFNAKTSASVEECVILKYILYCVSVKDHFSPLRSLRWYYSIYLQGAGTLMKWTWQSFRDLDSHLMCPSESHLVCLVLWTYRVEFVKQIMKKGSEIRIVDIFLAELEFLMLVSMTYIEVISSHSKVRCQHPLPIAPTAFNAYICKVSHIRQFIIYTMILFYEVMVDSTVCHPSELLGKLLKINSTSTEWNPWGIISRLKNLMYLWAPLKFGNHFRGIVEKREEEQV